MRTGFAHLPLHGGRAPAWLFSRMVRLSREILGHVVAEHGSAEVLRRLSDPFWFQAFGCVLGFDWHSSGVTTTVCGAIKEGIRGSEADFGFYAAGGKGATSRKTPGEIASAGERLSRDPSDLVYASRMSAKVDSAAVQDGYQLYHHAFFFTPAGDWAVVQQGMNDANGMARRYHWLSSSLKSFVEEPHEAVCCDARTEAWNFVAEESAGVRASAASLAREKPETTLDALRAASPARPPPPPRRAHGGRVRTVPAEDPPEDVRAGASRLRAAPRCARRRPEDAARARPRLGARLRHAGVDARPRAVLLRARRQGRSPVPGRPRGLRPDDRGAARRARPVAPRPEREDRRAEAARPSSRLRAPPESLRRTAASS